MKKHFILISSLLLVFLLISGCAPPTDPSLQPPSQKQEQITNSKSGIEGEFVVVEDPRAFHIPGPPCPVTRGITMRWQSEFWRAVITEKGDLLLLDVHGKKAENGSLIVSNTYGEDGLLSRTFHVMDIEFTIESVSGSLVGEKREEMYLPKAQKTVRIISSGEKVRMTGNETGDHFILKDLKKFAVSTIEKID
jgi:hypothetical protein